MSTSRNLITELRSASRPQVYETIKWSLALIIGSFLPIYGGWVLLTLFSQEVSLADFASQGELALYAAAFVVPSLYLVSKDAKDPFVHRQMFMLVGITMLLFSVLLFAAVVAAGGVEAASAATAPGAESVDGEPQGIRAFLLDRDLLVRLSLGVCAITLAYACLVNLLDNILMNADVSVIAAKAQAALSREFDALGGGNGQ